MTTKLRKVQAQRKFAQGAFVPTQASNNNNVERRADGQDKPVAPPPILQNLSAVALLDQISFHNLHTHNPKLQPVVRLERLPKNPPPHETPTPVLLPFKRISRTRTRNSNRLLRKMKPIKRGRVTRDLSPRVYRTSKTARATKQERTTRNVRATRNQRPARDVRACRNARAAYLRVEDTTDTEDDTPLTLLRTPRVAPPVTAATPSTSFEPGPCLTSDAAYYDPKVVQQWVNLTNAKAFKVPLPPKGTKRPRSQRTTRNMEKKRVVRNDSPSSEYPDSEYQLSEVNAATSQVNAGTSQEGVFSTNNMTMIPDTMIQEFKDQPSSPERPPSTCPSERYVTVRDVVSASVQERDSRCQHCRHCSLANKAERLSQAVQKSTRNANIDIYDFVAEREGGSPLSEFRSRRPAPNAASTSNAQSAGTTTEDMLLYGEIERNGLDQNGLPKLNLGHDPTYLFPDAMDNDFSRYNLVEHEVLLERLHVTLIALQQQKRLRDTAMRKNALFRQRTQGIPQQTQAVPQQTQVVPQQTQGVPQQTQGVPQQTQGVPQQTKGVPQQTQGDPQQTQGDPQQTQGDPQQTQGVPQKTQGVPQQTQGDPQQTLGDPQQTQGVPQQTQGDPQQTQGDPQQTQGVPQETQEGEQQPPVIQQPLAVVPQSTPVVPQSTPVVPQPTPVVPQSTPVVPQPTPVVPQSTPVVPQPTPVVPQPTPVVPQHTPVVQQQLSADPQTPVASEPSKRSSRGRPPTRVPVAKRAKRQTTASRAGSASGENSSPRAATSARAPVATASPCASTSQQPTTSSAGMPEQLPNNSFDGIRDAPVYYPTEDEFNDPVAYFEKIMPTASKHGLCKVVAPASFKPTCHMAEKMRFNVGTQYVARLYTRWGPGSREMCAIKAHLARHGVRFIRPPSVDSLEVDLPKLYRTVQRLGGLKTVMEKKRWGRVAEHMRFAVKANIAKKLDTMYVRYLVPYDTLSTQEREQIRAKVIQCWNKKNNKIIQRAMNPLQRQKLALGDETYESDPEDDGGVIGALVEAEDCIVGGRRMSMTEYTKAAQALKEQYFPSSEPTPREVEEEYWRIVLLAVEHISVFAASIDTGEEGYGFSKDNQDSYSSHPWNLKAISQNPGNMLNMLGPVMGVTVPTLHLGMMFSTSCWHRDPHGLPWMEYMHSGPAKIWYGIPADQSDAFRNVVQMLCPSLCQNKPIWLPSDVTMIPPSFLLSNQVSLTRVEQKPGEYIIVFPQAYSSSISTGFTRSESVYFATNSWLKSVDIVFHGLRDSCEPTMFSLEQLLIAVATVPTAPASRLQLVHTNLATIVENELQNRRELRRLGVVYKVTPRRQLPPARSWNDECEVCRSSLYLSKVVGLITRKSEVCLKHALHILTSRRPKKTPKDGTMLIYFTRHELHDIMSKLQSGFCPT